MWCAMLVLLALAGQRWTVGGSGPNNFPTIQAAIDAPEVQPGDTLLVHPGAYGDFTLTKELRIVAAAQQSFGAGHVRVEHVGEFTIAGMAATTLKVFDVTGRGRLDQCTIGHWIVGPPPWYPLVYWGYTELVDCAELIATRSTFHGSEGCYPYVTVDTNAVFVQRSTVAFVDCKIFGGNDDVCGNHPSSYGGPAVEVYEQSELTLAGTSIQGGGHSSIFPGYAALFLDSSHASIRGSPFVLISQGPGASPTSAISGAGSASATLSGVTISPPALPPWVIVVSEPEPWIRVTGPDAAGSSKMIIEVYGPTSAQVSVGLSATPLLTSTPLGLLWIDPGSLLRFYRTVALGQGIPSVHVLPLDALDGGPGEAFDLQALAVQPSLSTVLTNPAQAILRW